MVDNYIYIHLILEYGPICRFSLTGMVKCFAGVLLRCPLQGLQADEFYSSEKSCHTHCYGQGDADLSR